MILFQKNSKLYDLGTSTSQTDGQTNGQFTTTGNGEKMCLFKSLIICSLVGCRSLLSCSGAQMGLRKSIRNSDVPDFPLAKGIRVAPSGRFPITSEEACWFLHSWDLSVPFWQPLLLLLVVPLTTRSTNEQNRQFSKSPCRTICAYLLTYQISWGCRYNLATLVYSRPLNVVSLRSSQWHIVTYYSLTHITSTSIDVSSGSGVIPRAAWS